jgi:hypothetical protein
MIGGLGLVAAAILSFCMPARLCVKEGNDPPR